VSGRGGDVTGTDCGEPWLPGYGELQSSEGEHTLIEVASAGFEYSKTFAEILCEVFENTS